MNKTKTLLKAQIINFFPINEIKKRGNTQGSRIIVGLGVITLTLFIGVYNTMIAKTLVRIGQQELIPAYMVSVSSFCILFITIFYSNGILFGSKDIDMLLSLPVTNNEIISSKFFLMYLLNFFSFYDSRRSYLAYKYKSKSITNFVLLYICFICSINSYVYSYLYGYINYTCFIFF